MQHLPQPSIAQIEKYLLDETYYTPNSPDEFFLRKDGRALFTVNALEASMRTLRQSLSVCSTIAVLDFTLYETADAILLSKLFVEFCKKKYGYELYPIGRDPADMEDAVRELNKAYGFDALPLDLKLDKYTYRVVTPQQSVYSNNYSKLVKQIIDEYQESATFLLPPLQGGTHAK